MKSATNNWLKNILKAKYQQLQKLNTNDSLVKDTIETIESIEAEIAERFHQPSKEEYLESSYLFLIPNSFTFPYLQELAKIPNDEFLNTSLMPTLILKPKELLELVHDFFKEATSKQFYQDFIHFFQKRNTHLHFNSLPNGTYADTTYLLYYQEAYTQINPRKEFLDIPTLAHEYAHNIQFLNNYNKNLFSFLKPFVEIVSIFIELICAEYYTEHGFEKIGIITQFEELDTTLENIKSINKEIELLKTIVILPGQNKNNLVHNIQTLLAINEEETSDIIQETSSSSFIYDIAWLVATNLFQIYLNDPEKAFYLLYKIINLDLNLNAKTYFQELEKLGLTTPEGLSTYNNYIKRKLTRI